MKPRLLTVVEQFWHNAPGGTAVSTERTLTALAAGGEFELRGVAARGARRDREPVRRLPPGLALDVAALPRPLLYEAWLRYGRPSVDRPTAPDVVWASSMIVPPTAAPVVATVHDVDFLRHPDRLSGRGRRFFPLAWRRAIERSELIVCPSEVVATDCVAAGLPAERVAVVPWGVAPPICPAADVDAMVDPLGLPGSFVLWVGPVEPRKNPHAAAEAIDRLSMDLVVVGMPSAHPETATAFERLGRRVHALGRVSDRLLSALYRRAAALLYPSLAEGFGLPVLEAMVHGTPVVTSAGTATEEVAGGAALLVDPRRPDEIAEALVAAVSDGPARDRLIDAGIHRAAQLSWEATAKGYAEAFRSVSA